MASILEALEKFSSRFDEVRGNRPKRKHIVNYFKKSGVDIEALTGGGVPASEFNAASNLSDEFVEVEPFEAYLNNLAENDEAAAAQPVAPVVTGTPVEPEPGSESIYKPPSAVPALADLKEQYPGIEPVETLTMAPRQLLPNIDPEVVEGMRNIEGGSELLRTLEALRVQEKEFKRQQLLEAARAKEKATNYFKIKMRKQPPPPGLATAKKMAIKHQRTLQKARLAYDAYAKESGLIDLRGMKTEAGSVAAYLENLQATNPEYQKLIHSKTRTDSGASAESPTFSLLHHLVSAQRMADATQKTFRDLTEQWEQSPFIEELPEEKALKEEKVALEAIYNPLQEKWAEAYNAMADEMGATNTPADPWHGKGDGSLHGRRDSPLERAKSKHRNLYNKYKEAETRLNEISRKLGNFARFSTAEPNDLIPYNAAGTAGDWLGSWGGASASLGTFVLDAVGTVPLTMIASRLPGQAGFYGEVVRDPETGQPVMEPKRDGEEGEVVLDDEGNPVMVPKQSIRFLTPTELLQNIGPGEIPDELKPNTGAGVESGWFANVDLQQNLLKERFSQAAVEDAAMMITGIAHLVGTVLPSPDVFLNTSARGGNYTPEELMEILQRPDGIEEFRKRLEGAYGGFKDLTPQMVGALIQIVANPIRSFNSQPVSTILTLLPAARLSAKAGVKGAAIAVAELENMAATLGVDANAMNGAITGKTVKAINRRIQKLADSAELAIAENKWAQFLTTKKLQDAMKLSRKKKDFVEGSPELKAEFAQAGKKPGLGSASEMLDYAAEVGIVNPLLKTAMTYGTYALALDDDNFWSLDPWVMGSFAALGPVTSAVGRKFASPEHVTNWNQMMSDVAFQSDPVMSSLAHSIKSETTAAGSRVRARMARLAEDGQRRAKDGSLLIDPSNGFPYQESVIYSIKERGLSAVDRARAAVDENGMPSPLHAADLNLQQAQAQAQAAAQVWDLTPEMARPVEVVGLGQFDTAPANHGKFIADVEAARGSRPGSPPSEYSIIEVETPGGGQSGFKTYVHRNPYGKESIYVVDTNGVTVAYMDYRVNPTVRGAGEFAGLDPLKEAPQAAAFGKAGFLLQHKGKAPITVNNFGLADGAAASLQGVMIRHLQSRAGAVDGVVFEGAAQKLNARFKGDAQKGKGGVPYEPGVYTAAHDVHPHLVERAIAQRQAVPKEVLELYRERLNISPELIEKALPQFERFPVVREALKDVAMQENLVWHEVLREAEGGMGRENSIRLGLERLDRIRTRLKTDHASKIDEINESFDQRVAEAQARAEATAKERAADPNWQAQRNAVLDRATKRHTATLKALDNEAKILQQDYLKDLTTLKAEKRSVYDAQVMEIANLLERRTSVERVLREGRTLNKRWRKQTVETLEDQVVVQEAAIATAKKSASARKGRATAERNKGKKTRNKKGISHKVYQERLAKIDADLANELKGLETALLDSQNKLSNFTKARARDAAKVTEADITIGNKRDALSGLDQSFANRRMSLESQRAANLDALEQRRVVADAELASVADDATGKPRSDAKAAQEARDAQLAKAQKAHEKGVAQVDALANQQLKRLAALTQEVRANLFGVIDDAPQLTEYNDKGVRFDPDLGVFVPEALPEGLPSARFDLTARLGALMDRVRAAPGSELAEGFRLILDISDEMARSEGGLQYSAAELGRISKKIGIDIRNPTSELARQLKGVVDAGGKGGVNRIRRVYADALMSFVTDNVHARMLASEAMRGRFRSWLLSKKGYNIREQLFGKQTAVDKAVSNKQLGAGLDQLLIDFSSARSNGGSLFQFNDPVIMVGEKAIRISDVFADWAMTEMNPVQLADAASGALNSMSHMMARNVEARTSAAIVAKEMQGVKGWGDTGMTLSNGQRSIYSIDYAEGIFRYMDENGRVPPALKGTASQFDVFIDLPEVANNLANRIGADGVSRLKKAVGEYHNGYLELKDAIPTMSDIGAAAATVYERGVGLSRSKLPVMIDNVSSLAESMGITANTYVDAGLRSTLGWLHETTALLQTDVLGMTALSQYMKVNLTALRPTTFVNNVMSNVYAKLVHEGVDPVTAVTQLIQAIELTKKAKYAPETLAKAVLDDFNYLRDTGFDWSTFIDAEGVGAIHHSVKSGGAAHEAGAAFQAVQNLTHSGKIGGMDIPIAGKVLPWITQKLIDGYRMGDIVFKVDTSIREMAKSRSGLESLGVGRRITFTDINTGQIQGRVFRLKGNKYEFVDSRGKSTVVDSIDHPLINRARAQSAMGKANARFVDFADAQGFLKLTKKYDWLVGGPFKTWIWKTIDIPGWKKGIVYHTFFDDFSMMSNDVALFNDLVLEAAGTHARRSLVANVYDHVEEGDIYKRRLIPQWQQMTADFKPDSKSYTSVGQKNFGAGLWTLLQAWEIQSRGVGLKKMGKELRREKGGLELVLTNMLFGDGLVTGMYEGAVTGVSKSGKPYDNLQDYAWAFADLLLPGYQNAGIDSTVTMMNPISEWSRYDLDRRMDPQQHMRTDAYLLKNLIGFRLSQFDPKTQYAAWKAIPGILRSEYRKKREELEMNLDVSSEDRVKRLIRHDENQRIMLEEFEPEWKKLGALIEDPSIEEW